MALLGWDKMPRAKPDRVDVIRFELGNKERELLESVVFGLQVKNIGTPAVALLSDASAMLIVAASLSYIGLNVDVTGLTNSADIVQEIIGTIEATRSELTDDIDDPLLSRLGILGRIFKEIGDFQRNLSLGNFAKD